MQTAVTIIYRYELLVGETPFGRGSPKATMALIAETTKDPYFPSHLSTYAIDIIKRLLTRDQAARLVLQAAAPTVSRNVCSSIAQGYGHDGAAAIKIHPFFRVIDWHALANGKVDDVNGHWHFLRDTFGRSCRLL
jgi:hypothetical protein